MDQQRNTKRLKPVYLVLTKQDKVSKNLSKGNPVEHRNTCLWSELDDQSNLHNAIKLY